MKHQKQKFSKLTGFQRRVFSLLPSQGKITTYSALAKKLKTSPRAVARALARNPFPIKIPCHRVVRSDGKIGGYIFGTKRKRTLLREEGIKI